MRFAKPAFITALSLALLSACTAPGADNPQQLISRPAPAFSLVSKSGSNVALADFKGKVVLIDFWASWCPPCRESFPHLQKVVADEELRKAGLVVLAINQREDWQTIKSFVDSYKFSGTTLRDADGSVAKTYAVREIPTTIVVGRDGTVQAVFSEYTADTAAQIDAAVARALK